LSEEQGDAIVPARTPTGRAGLSRGDRWALAVLAAAFVLFGAVVEVRSAFLHRRMGDLEVFLRAAWAVRAGADLYTVTDSKGFHYHYPPAFAILLAPLAEPPPGQGGPLVPYPVTVGLWYVLGVVSLAAGVHRLASALERASAGRCPPPDSRRWWALRVLPVLACLPAVGSCLGRGQVSLLVLLLLCGMAAALLRGRGWQAGFWLAGAVCLKVIPAYLLLYPVYRRDARCLAGCALGLLLGLAVLPAAVFGPARARAYYGEWTDVLVRPALGAGEDRSRARELLDVTATDSQSFLATLHNTLHPDRATRPARASAPVTLAHWLLGAVLTGLTLLAGRGRQDRACPALLTFGALVVLNHLVSPVCHLHYLCAAVPLAMGLVAAAWERSGTARVGVGTSLLLAANAVAGALPHVPGLEVLRDGGLAMYGALLLWAAGSVSAWGVRLGGGFLAPLQAVFLKPSPEGGTANPDTPGSVRRRSRTMPAVT
jgi:hypothetical protein